MSAIGVVELLDCYSQVNYYACCSNLFVAIKCVFSAFLVIPNHVDGLERRLLPHAYLYRKVDYEKLAHF